jgi:hypothetical protein
MGVIRRLIKYVEDLIARYNAALDYGEGWKHSKPLSKSEVETVSELKRRSSDA